MSCTLCPGSAGTTFDASAMIPLRDGGTLSCAVVDITLGSLVPSVESPACVAVQSILGQGLCGCEDTDTTNPMCSLCPNGAKVPETRLATNLDFLDASSLLSTDWDNPVMTNLLGTLQVNCALVQAFVESSDDGQALCETTQVLLQEYCCAADFASPTDPCVIQVMGDEPIVSLADNLILTCTQLSQAASVLWEKDAELCGLANALAILSECAGATTNNNNNNTTNPSTLSSKESPCTLCRDGSAVTLPDKILDPSLLVTSESDTGMAFIAQVLQPTCADFEVMVQHLYRQSDETCHQIQSLSASCGCPTAPDPCHLCDADDSIVYPDHYHYHAEEYFDIRATCSQLEIGLLQYDADSRECFLARETNWECGCNKGFHGYLGTETRRDQRILTWTGRSAGILAFMGALFILLDNTLWDRTKGLRKKSIYRQLMCFVASFDALSALIWIIGPLPVPKTYDTGLELNVYGNHGNDATCTAQAFFAQLGYGSIYFNTTLSVYYFLVVVKQWTNRDLEKARVWFFVIPAVCAVGMAMAGLPFYEHAWVVCYIQPYPYRAERRTTYMATIPLLLMALISTCLQVLVYNKVRKQVRRSLKWTFDANTQTKQKVSAASTSGMNLKLRLPKVFVNNMEAAVFWQSLSYLSTFYLCWVVMAVIAEFAHHQIWPLWVITFAISPLPGFLNCLVYVRPRLLTWQETRQKKRGSAKKREKTKTSSIKSSDFMEGKEREEESSKHQEEPVGTGEEITSTEEEAELAMIESLI